MENAFNTLNNYLKGSKRSGINESVARFMLAYFDELPRMRLSEVSERCHASTTSVIRFCRELGYKDFTDFKRGVENSRQEIGSLKATANVPLQLMGTQDEYEASLESWISELSNINMHAMLALDRNQVLRLSQDVIGYRYVYVFGNGTSGVVGELLRVYLAYYGKTIFSLSEPSDDFWMTTEKDVTLAILVTQHGRILRSNEGLLTNLVRGSDKLWAITQMRPEQVIPGAQTIYLESFGCDDAALDGNLTADIHILMHFAELLGRSCEQVLEQGRD